MADLDGHVRALLAQKIGLEPDQLLATLRPSRPVRCTSKQDYGRT